MKTIDSRVMIIRLRSTVPITIIAIYAPTAPSPTTEKDTFYKILKEEYRKGRTRGIAIIMGDFNVRLQAKFSDEEAGVGPHTFDKYNSQLGKQSPDVTDNRNRFTSFVEQTNRTGSSRG